MARLGVSILEQKFQGGLNTAALELVNMSRAILLISNFIFVANTTLTLRRAFTSIANRSGDEEQELIYAQSRRERLVHTSRSRHAGRPTVEGRVAGGRGGIGAQRR